MTGDPEAMPVDTPEDGDIPPELTDPFDVGMKADYALAESRVASDLAPLSAKSFPRASSVNHGRDTKITIVSPPFVTSYATRDLCPGGCIQPCHCSSRPDTKIFVALKGKGVIRTEEAVLYAPTHLEHPYSRSLIFNTLLQFGKKRLRRLPVSRRTLSHVTLAKVTKPVTNFASTAELVWVFRSYFHTLLSLRRHGWEATNVSLENLAIAPRPRKRKMIGKGIITLFDDKNHDPSWKLRPRFIYTMPCRTLLTDDLPDPTRLASLESLLLCLIWIATTRSTAFDKRRPDSSYCLDETDIGRWNRRDWYNDVSGRYQDSQKLRVMQSEDLFESRVIRKMAPYFLADNITTFLCGLRAIIYDPKWQSARDLIIKLSVGGRIAKGSSFKKLTQCLLRAVERDELVAQGTLEALYPPATDHCTTIEKHKDEAPSKESQQAKEEWGKEALDKPK